MKELQDSVPNHFRMPHHTYSGLLWFYIILYIDIQIDNDIHQRVFLDDRLAHDNVFCNIFFL